MKKKVKRSPLPVYAVALVWLVWGLFFPLYTLVHFILALGVSLLVFGTAKKIWQDKVIMVPNPRAKEQPQEQTAPAAPAAAATSTGNPELDALMTERDRAISEMRRLNDSIADEKLSSQIDHLEEMTRKIIGCVVENPRKLAQIRKFLNYYLPTTLKLLNAYDRMDAAGVSGANIDGTMGKVDAIMDTVVVAFDRQLDALFGDEALDISTDITVMEQLLAQEGIGGMQMGG